MGYEYNMYSTRLNKESCFKQESYVEYEYVIIDGLVCNEEM